MSDVVSASSEMHPPPERVLPDRTLCLVRPIGTISAFANCLVERPKECPYVLYFGEGNVCRYPQWRDFIAPVVTSSEVEAVNE